MCPSIPRLFDMSHIAVHGAASASVPPEIAIARIVVEFTGADHPVIFARARQAHATVTTSAVALRDSNQVDRIVAPAVRGWVFDDWIQLDGRSEQKTTRYRAGSTIDIWFTDLAVLGAWLSEIVGIPGVEVRGITWDILDSTRDATMRHVRTEATQDAVQRASDYADALGLADVRLSGIFELLSQPEGETPPARPVVPTRGVARGESSLDLRPDNITLTSFVRAEFDAD